MPNALKGLILVVMLVVAAAYWIGSQPKQKIDLSQAGPEISAENPMEVKDFSLPDAKGRLVKLSDFKGKPIVLNFWAAWCPPCVEELPSLLEFAQWAEKNLGAVTIAVSSDPDWKAVDKLFEEKKFWPRGKLPLTILLNPDASAAGSYGTSKYPETYFIDRDFKVIRKFAGIQNWSSEEIKRWVAENSR